MTAARRRGAVTACDEGMVLAMEALTEPVVIEGGHRVTALAMHSGSNQVVAGFEAGDVWIIDAVGGRTLCELDDLDDCVGAVAVTRDGTTAVAAIRDADTARMWLWDLETGETSRRFHNQGAAILAALGRDGEYGLTVGSGRVCRWGVRLPDGGKSFRAFELDTGTPLSVAVSSDAGCVAIGSREGHLRTFDLKAASAGVFVDCGAPVRAVALTPDAMLVLSADDDRTVRVWDTRSGDHLRALKGHAQPVQEISIDDAGARAATISGDGMARLWDLASGRALATIHGEVALTACAVSGSGAVLLGDDGGRVYVLPEEWLLGAAEHELPRPDVAATARELAGDGPIIAPGIVGRKPVAEGTILAIGEDGEEESEEEDDGLPNSQAAEALGRIIAEAAMAEARDLYRGGNYRASLSALDELDDPIRSFPICQAFWQYVANIVAGSVRPKSPQSVEPEGSFKDVDAMHFFLVRDEIKEAKELIEADRDGDAVPVLDRALQHAPYFPYANFLKALAMHASLGQRLERGRMLPGDLQAYLEEALEHARLGASDPEIGAAQTLQETLQAELEALHDVAGQGDTALVKPLMERYGKIGDDVEGGLQLAGDVRKVAGKLRRLKRDVLAARTDVSGPVARAALEALEDRIEQDLRQFVDVQDEIANAARLEELATELAAIRRAAEEGADPVDLLRRLERLESDLGSQRQEESNDAALEAIDKLASVVSDDRRQVEEVAAVAPLAQRYGRLMEGAQITSAAEAKALAKKLRALAKDVDKARRRTGTKPGSPLGELSDAIARNLDQLDSVEDPDPNVAEFNALAEDFQRTMRSIEGGITSQDQLFEFVGDLASIRGRAEKLKKEMKGRDGKKAVEQLLEAIDNVVKQLA